MRNKDFQDHFILFTQNKGIGGKGSACWPLEYAAINAKCSIRICKFRKVFPTHIALLRSIYYSSVIQLLIRFDSLYGFHTLR